MKHKNMILNTAAKSDCKDLWIWRNYPDVRRGFFDDKPVPWEKHKEWFHARVNDKNTKIYIARQRKDKVGVIRFEIENAFIKVSVNLNPHFFGKGLGAEIIKAGTIRLFDEIGTNKPIIAEIKKDNIASQKAFARAGYALVNETERKIVYKREVSHV